MTSENASDTGSSHDDEMYRKVDDVHIRVSGLGDEDGMVRDGVYSEIVKSLVKIKKMIHVTDFTLNVKKYHEKGGRKKYSIKARAIGDSGDFQSDDHEWDIFTAVKITLEKLGREIYRKEDRGKVHSRAP